MRKSLVVLVAALACAWLFSATASTASAGDRHVVNLKGVIAEVGNSGIVLHTRRGNVRIGVVDRTEITLNGDPVRLGALERGDHAAVRAVLVRRGDHRRLVAIFIHARRDR